MRSIDQSGLIGLLTQVHTQSAEIELISSGQSIVPVAVSRTGERNLAYGNGNGLDLRYFPTGSDLKLCIPFTRNKEKYH